MRFFSFRLKPRTDEKPHHYFHRMKANGAMVLHRQRRPSLDEILAEPAIPPSRQKAPSTWSPASAPKDDLQARRQELLKHYMVQHQRRSRELEQDDREKLQQQVQHLKRMVTLLRTMVLSSTSLDDDDDSTLSYERKLQILFQEISALHREQEHSAQEFRELQHRHEALCAKLREKDEMVTCLQSDLRAYMINE